MTMYYVYILQSQKKGIFYRGVSNNLTRRFEEHNNGFEKATKAYKPWNLVWFTTKETKSDALKLEKKLKNLGTQKRIISLFKNILVSAAKTIHLWWMS